MSPKKGNTSPYKGNSPNQGGSVRYNDGGSVRNLNAPWRNLERPVEIPPVTPAISARNPERPVAPVLSSTPPSSPSKANFNPTTPTTENPDQNILCRSGASSIRSWADEVIEEEEQKLQVQSNVAVAQQAGATNYRGYRPASVEDYQSPPLPHISPLRIVKQKTQTLESIEESNVTSNDQVLPNFNVDPVTNVSQPQTPPQTPHQSRDSSSPVMMAASPENVPPSGWPTYQDLAELEVEYIRSNHNPSFETKLKIATKMGVDVSKIENWFENRIARAQHERRTMLLRQVREMNAGEDAKFSVKKDGSESSGDSPPRNGFFFDAATLRSLCGLDDNEIQEYEDHKIARDAEIDNEKQAREAEKAKAQASKETEKETQLSINHGPARNRSVSSRIGNVSLWENIDSERAVLEAMDGPDFYDRRASVYMRGYVETTFSLPHIEIEWSNNVEGGLQNVVPLMHSLVIGKYGTLPYEPRSYVPKTKHYKDLTEIQLRYLIHKRDFLGCAVSFPAREGIHKSALVKFLEDQDIKVKTIMYDYKPIILSEEENDGIRKIDVDKTRQILAALDQQIAKSDMFEQEQHLFEILLPSQEEMYASADGNMIGTKVAIMSLQQLFDYGAVPRTGDFQVFHGLRALATSLHTERVCCHIREGWDFEELRPITPDMMHALLFGDTFNIPTMSYAVYIERMLGSYIPQFHNWFLTEKQAYQDGASMRNNPTIHQLAAIIDLLFECHLLNRQYALGVIYQGEPYDDKHPEDIPSSAVIVGDASLPVIWVVRTKKGNSQINQMGDCTHYEGFGYVSDDNAEEMNFAQMRVASWGMRKIAIAESIAHTKDWRFNYDHSFDNPMKAIVDFVKDRKCDNCKDDFSKPCIGRPCGDCVETGRPCRPLRHGNLMAPFVEIKKPKILCVNKDVRESWWNGLSTEERAKVEDAVKKAEKAHEAIIIKRNPFDWDFVDTQWEQNDMRLMDTSYKRWVAESEPEGPYYLVITCSRINSTTPNFHDLRHKCLFSSPEIARSHERLLLTGLHKEYKHLGATAERPGGRDSARRNMYLSYIDRPGFIGVFTEKGGSQRADESARAFADLIHELLALGRSNLPLEINFLMESFNGFCVGFEEMGWGVGCGGLYDVIQLEDRWNNTNILDRIYITVVVDPKLVDGQSPESLHYPIQTTGFVGFQGRMYAKYKLTSLVKAHWMAKSQANSKCVVADFPHHDNYWDDRIRNAVFILGQNRELENVQI